jgi:hypothetical protein
MHDNYETGTTDMETIYMVFIIDGKQKLIRDYGNSAPSSLWAVEQLIDKLLTEAEWDKPEKPAGKK